MRVSVLNITNVKSAHERGLLQFLSPERRTLYDSISLAEKKSVCMYSYLLALLEVARMENKDVSYIRFSRSGNGKPFAIGCAVKFSISHSHGKVAIALDRVEVGVDVEMVRQVDLGVMGRAFTRREINSVEMAEDRMRRFFEIWTAKESVIKRFGGKLFDIGRIESLDCNVRTAHFGGYVLSHSPAADEPEIAFLDADAIASEFLERTRRGSMT